MPFIILPVFSFFRGDIILIVAAIVPAVALLSYIYKMDSVDKESPRMILTLALSGIVSTFVASMCERLGSGILSLFFRDNSSVIYNVILYFGIVGLSEEAAKYVLLRNETWKSPEFNCKFDGIIYAVAVSLGFALWENIGYVMKFGFATALLRAVTAVPGHACFGVFMGVWYGLAKRCSLEGDDAGCNRCKRLCVLMPAFIHGCYDYIATMTEANHPMIFVGFIAVMFLISFLVVRRMSKTDRYLSE